MTLLTFPCAFPIKIIGEANPSFEAVVMQILRAQVPDLGEGAVEIQESKGGKYKAMRVTIQATSQAQLDAIYTALSADKHVMVVL